MAEIATWDEVGGEVGSWEYEVTSHTPEDIILEVNTMIGESQDHMGPKPGDGESPSTSIDDIEDEFGRDYWTDYLSLMNQWQSSYAGDYVLGVGPFSDRGHFAVVLVGPGSVELLSRFDEELFEVDNNEIFSFLRQRIQ